MIISLSGRRNPNDVTVIQDHAVKSFTVTIRTMGTVTEETIKRLLQEKPEVVAVQQTDEVIFVR